MKRWIPYSPLYLLIAVLLFSATALGQQQETTRILFVLDGSGSMDNMWGNGDISRISSAKTILTEIADSLKDAEGVELGLRVYGHQSPVGHKNCKDTRLEVGFSKNSTSLIKDKLKYINPKGTTPIAYALERAGQDFPDGKGRNIIILLTDGEEACEGDPCAVAQALEKKGIVLKHFVIGLGVDDRSMSTFGCIGESFNARNQDMLRNTLGGIVTRIVTETTTQVDLLDGQQQLAYTDLPMTFYNNVFNILKYPLYHTLMESGLPDTLSIDPVLVYDVTVHTLPSVTQQDVVLTTDQHNHIKIPTPQGWLNIQMLGQDAKASQEVVQRLRSLVIDPESGKTIHVQQFGEQQQFLTGTYTLELLTLPRKTITGVTIEEGDTTRVQIPNPGIVNISKKYEVYGGIFVQQGKLLKRIYGLHETDVTEQVALQPGQYFLVYRAIRNKSMHSSKTIPFTIRSGESITVKIE